MHESADHHGILSHSHEGVRPSEGYCRQLQMVMNMLSDAKLMHQGMIAPYWCCKGRGTLQGDSLALLQLSIANKPLQDGCTQAAVGMLLDSS